MSQSWMQGYTSDVEYTSGYYREQEPAYLNLSAILHGVEPVQINKSFTYCELGCGMGHTSLIMAANYPQGKFIAIDFNPTHISQAKRLAEAAGLKNIEFLELSFEELACDSSLLPKCDFITFHGIYAWINDNNRQYISDICKHHLNSGGLVYNSYNAQPGWAAVAPLQKTINLLSQQYSGNSVERFSSAVNYINKFRELKPRYFEFNNTTLEPRLNYIEKADPAYLVHEYLNEGWQALYFPDVANSMALAKLDYVGLANPAEAYSHSVIPDKFKQQLAELDDLSSREMMKDLAFNTSFRKDLYSRGGRRIDAKQQIRLLSAITWTLTSAEDQTEFKFNLSVGEVSGNTDTYNKVIKVLAKKPSTIKELEESSGINFSNLIQTLVFLFSNNSVAIENLNSASSHTVSLNKALISENENSQQLLAIAASKIGSALLLNPIELAFLNSYLNSDHDSDINSEAISEKIYEDLLSKGLSITISGKTYKDNDMKNQLKEIEKSWLKETLPRIIKLGCV